MSLLLESSSGLEAFLEGFDYNTHMYKDHISEHFKIAPNYERTLAGWTSPSTKSSVDKKRRRIDHATTCKSLQFK